MRSARRLTLPLLRKTTRLILALENQKWPEVKWPEVASRFSIRARQLRG